MGGRLTISGHELRASGSAAHRIARDLEKPLEKAMRDARTAGEALQSWAVGTQLLSSEALWSEALGALKERLHEHGNGLRLVADGHGVHDVEVSGMFRGW